MKNKAKLFGFTLLELLFVVAISSVLIAVGLSMATQYSEEIKVKKAALQMNQLLQAGLEYYADNSCWPGGSICAVTTPPTFDNTNYIPNDATTNPWGNSYTWDIASDGNFEVQAVTPSAAIASRIAGILPSGTVSAAGSSCAASNCVLAETAIARLPPKQPNITLVALGEQTISNSPDGGTTITLPAKISATLPTIICPTGSMSTAVITSIRDVEHILDEEGEQPSSPQMLAGLNISVSSCPKDVHGYVINSPPCAMQVTFGYDTVYFTVQDHGSGGTYRNLNITMYSQDTAQYTAFSSLTFQYEIYCCSTPTCSPP